MEKLGSTLQIAREYRMKKLFLLKLIGVVFLYVIAWNIGAYIAMILESN